MLAEYYTGQIKLFSDLCRGSNAKAMFQLNMHFPYEALVHALGSPSLPFLMRSKLCGLLHHIYIDRFPHDQLTIPSPVYCYERPIPGSIDLSDAQDPSAIPASYNDDTLELWNHSLPTQVSVCMSAWWTEVIAKAFKTDSANTDQFDNAFNDSIKIVLDSASDKFSVLQVRTPDINHTYLHGLILATHYTNHCDPLIISMYMNGVGPHRDILQSRGLPASGEWPITSVLVQHGQFAKASQGPAAAHLHPTGRWLLPLLASHQ